MNNPMPRNGSTRFASRIGARRSLSVMVSTPFPKRIRLTASSLIAATIGGLTLGSDQPDTAMADKGGVTDSFSAMSVWDDGLCEMS